MSRIDHLLWHSLGTLRRFEEFIRTLVYGLDLWIYPKAALLLLIILLYYIIYLFIYLFAKQQWRENRFFLFEWHHFSLFVNFYRQPFYVQCLFHCSVIVSFPLYRYTIY